MQGSNKNSKWRDWTEQLVIGVISGVIAGLITWLITK